MNIKALEYFLKIAETENVTDAAKALGMAQPPLSRQLRKLEEELGVELFIRGTRKMILTDEGRALKEHAEQILRYVKQTEEDIRTMKDDISGTISIVGIESYLLSDLPDVIKLFKKRYPNVHFKVIATSSQDAMRQVEIGVAEIGIVRRYVETENFETIDIESLEWMVALPKGHPLDIPEKEFLTPEDLSSYDLVLPENKYAQIKLTEIFEKAGYPANVVATVEPHMMSIECTIRNIGLALILGSGYLERYKDLVTLKPLRPAPYVPVTSAICSRYYSLSRASKAFYNLLQELHQSDAKT